MVHQSLLSGDNAAFLDDNYRAWLQDPGSVDPVWAALFASVQEAPPNGARFAPPAADARSLFAPAAHSAPAAAPAAAHAGDVERAVAVVQLVNAWRVRGHMLANIDPLQRLTVREHPELTPAFHGLGPEDLAAEVPTRPLFGMPERATLGAVLERLRAVYAGSIGAEFMNIDDLEQKRWVQRQLEELPDRQMLQREEELRFFRKLCDAESFERLVHTRFPGTKRFSLEGGETLIPLLDMVLTHAARSGVREVVMGMAHRGRLNTLVNVLEKPAGWIVAEFQDSVGTQGSGDVKYHLGYSSDVRTVDGDVVHLSLTPNPSHLEVVNAVVEGRVRAKQDRVGDHEGKLVLPLLLHGDAAFVGQGSVAEVLQLSELDGYATGGTIHVVINNQIGFTTAPAEGRSTPYATDMARMLGVPILHVNGEDPRAVAACVRIATGWRQQFQRDVVIDMYCYRKHGHNEGDEPSFTQPLEYEAIRRRPTPRENYAERLVALGRVQRAELDAILAASQVDMERDAFPEDGKPPSRPRDPEADSPQRGRWTAATGGDVRDEVATGVPMERLQGLLRAANTLPERFEAHAKVKRLVKDRLEMAEGARPIDWSVAEQAAFATLLTEGFTVRLSGQDSGRGTFSQRHTVWTDVRTGAEHRSLQHLAPDQRPFHVIDSNLSEFGVLGFEYGYSLDTPDGLVLWEAQFGDFVNGAQVVIDQYMCAAEQKWGRLSGLVLLLPHGYEGQGPEHSSARLERFLQSCAQENLQVANCTTPANYFHLLRRQVIRNVRKPLILMTPKSLLRNARCVSSLDELAHGVFRRVIADEREVEDDAVARIVFCSGKVFYDLEEALTGAPDRGRVLVHRVEQLYPFPGRDVRLLAEAAPHAEIVWCQEEPRNMGAWPSVAGWFADHLPAGRTVRYVGRPDAASPATGSHHKHKEEQDALVHAALTLS